MFLEVVSVFKLLAGKSRNTRLTGQGQKATTSDRVLRRPPFRALGLNSGLESQEGPVMRRFYVLFGE